MDISIKIPEHDYIRKPVCLTKTLTPAPKLSLTSKKKKYLLNTNPILMGDLIWNHSSLLNKGKQWAPTLPLSRLNQSF